MKHKVTTKYFRLHRNIILTGWVSFLTDISTKMVYSVMPLFLMSIGASKTSLSLIEGIAESTASLIKTYSGFRSDKIGRNKPLMIWGYGLSGMIMPLFAFVATPMQVLYLRFIERIGKGIRTAPRDSLIAGSVINGETGKSFGFQKAMDNSGAIAGPLMAFALLALFANNYQLIFLLSGIPALMGVVLLIFGIREVKKQNGTLQKFRFQHFPKHYYLFLGITFLFTLGNSTDALLLVKANETGIPSTYVPLLYMLTNLVAVVLAIPVGILADKIGKEKILVAGYTIYAIVYWGFGSSTSIHAIIILFGIYGIYSAATDSIQKALVADIIPANAKGTGMGIYNALLGITLLPASLIAGVLYEKVNAQLPFYFGSACAMGAATLMVLFHFRKSQSKA